MKRAVRSPAANACAALAIFATACSRGEDARGVVHLDLRLADGSSSAERLAAIAPTIVGQVAPAHRTDSLSPWKLANAEVRDAPGSSDGFYVIGNVREGDTFKKVELVLDEPFKASDVDAIELVLAKCQRGLARVTWRSSEDPADLDTWIRNVNAHVEDADGEQTITLPLADQPLWRGTIQRVSIVPKQDGWQRFELRAVRLVHGGFHYGADRLDQGGDGGLIALEREARRVWPANIDDELWARNVHVPRNGRVTFECAVLCKDRAVAPAVFCLVEAQQAAGTSGAKSLPRLEEEVFDPAQTSVGWKRFSADLSALAGESCDLRFRIVERGGSGTAPSRTAFSAVYWAAPIVIGELARDRRPNLVLVTLDTTRADAIGAFGASPSRTPYFDALAEHALVFTNAWSACNATSPSHASILTGLAVQDHGVTDNRSMLGPENWTLAERLRDAGYYTAAAVSVEHLQADKSGLGQGFDQFLYTATDASRDGAVTIRAVKQWLADWKSTGDRPFFLWVHLFDAHTPYEPSKEFLAAYCARWKLEQPPKTVAGGALKPNEYSKKGEFLEGVDNPAYPEFLYGAEVAYEDSLVENLMAEIAHDKWLDHTALAIVADHGESLGEHEHWYNHLGLYGEVLHVPLLLSAPEIGARRVDSLVSSLDLAPTFLELAGLRSDALMRGTSLLGAGAAARARTIFFEHSDNQQAGLRDDSDHVIWSRVDFAPWDGAAKRAANQLELYRFASDPKLEHDLAPSSAEAAAKHVKVLESWSASAMRRAGARRVMSPEEEASLRKLGYFGSEH